MLPHLRPITTSAASTTEETTPAVRDTPPELESASPSRAGSYLLQGLARRTPTDSGRASGSGQAARQAVPTDTVKEGPPALAFNAASSASDLDVMLTNARPLERRKRLNKLSALVADARTPAHLATLIGMAMHEKAQAEKLLPVSMRTDFAFEFVTPNWYSSYGPLVETMGHLNRAAGAWEAARDVFAAAQDIARALNVHPTVASEMRYMKEQSESAMLVDDTRVMTLFGWQQFMSTLDPMSSLREQMAMTSPARQNPWYTAPAQIAHTDAAQTNLLANPQRYAAADPQLYRLAKACFAKALQTHAQCVDLMPIVKYMPIQGFSWALLDVARMIENLRRKEQATGMTAQLAAMPASQAQRDGIQHNSLLDEIEHARHELIEMALTLRAALAGAPMPAQPQQVQAAQESQVPARQAIEAASDKEAPRAASPVRAPDTAEPSPQTATTMPPQTSISVQQVAIDTADLAAADRLAIGAMSEALRTLVGQADAGARQAALCQAQGEPTISLCAWQQVAKAYDECDQEAIRISTGSSMAVQEAAQACRAAFQRQSLDALTQANQATGALTAALQHDFTVAAARHESALPIEPDCWPKLAATIECGLNLLNDDTVLPRMREISPEADRAIQHLTLLLTRAASHSGITTAKALALAERIRAAGSLPLTDHDPAIWQRLRSEVLSKAGILMAQEGQRFADMIAPAMSDGIRRSCWAFDCAHALPAMPMLPQSAHEEASSMAPRGASANELATQMLDLSDAVRAMREHEIELPPDAADFLRAAHRIFASNLLNMEIGTKACAAILKAQQGAALAMTAHAEPLDRAKALQAVCTELSRTGILFSEGLANQIDFHLDVSDRRKTLLNDASTNAQWELRHLERTVEGLRTSLLLLSELQRARHETNNLLTRANDEQAPQAVSKKLQTLKTKLHQLGDQYERQLLNQARQERPTDAAARQINQNELARIPESFAGMRLRMDHEFNLIGAMAYGTLAQRCLHAPHQRARQQQAAVIKDKLEGVRQQTEGLGRQMHSIAQDWSGIAAHVTHEQAPRLASLSDDIRALEEAMRQPIAPQAATAHAHAHAQEGSASTKSRKGGKGVKGNRR